MFRNVFLIVLLLACAGCSVPSKEMSIYFFKEGKLFAVSRELPTIENQVLVAIDQLLQGPNDHETAEGIMTEIPNGTRAVKVDVVGDTAIVDMNSRHTEFNGDTASVRMVLAQIIYTATSVKGVKKVMIKLEGSDQFTLGVDKFAIDGPLTRDDVKI
jgi:spore germination protein GerM